MKKVLWLTVFIMLGATLSLGAQGQTLSLSGTITTGTAINYNLSTEVWVSGTLTVTRSSLSSNPYFTIDLSPNADTVGGVWPRNANWTHYDTLGGSSSFYIDNSEIYVGIVQSIYSPVFKKWDVTGVGDAGVTSSNIITGQFSGSSLTATFYFCAVSWHDNWLDAGFYELPLTFRLRSEAFSTGEPTTQPVSTLTLIERFVVGTAATIFFKVGSQEVTEIAFSEPSTPVSQTFTISVQANFRFYLSVKSKNLGYMNHERYGAAVSPVNERIPYTLSIDGTSIPLSAGTYKFPTRQWSTGFGTAAKNYTGTVSLGTVSNYSAGKYLDALSFIVTSN